MVGGRVAALDVLRGVAILGTLGTNIWIFTTPGGAAGFLSGGGSGFAETFLRFLSNGKFLALLSIMFGIGLAMQHASAVRRGERWPGWYLWRSALLLLEGLIHYVLIFEFDVLMFYALVSVLVAYLVGRGDKVIRGWMIGQAVLLVSIIGLLTWALLASKAGGPSGGLPADTSSWFAQVQARLDYAGVYRVEAIFAIPLSTVLFLAGARLLRAGALEDSDRGKRIQRGLTVWGLGLGVPLNAVTSFAGTEWFLVDRYLCAPVVAFGLLGLITMVVNRMRAEAGVVRRGLTSVGRAALTCYVGQNVIASILCYDWGFGLNGHGPAVSAALWLVISVLLMAGAAWWLRRHERGPVEALWQWAYRAPQPRPALR
ncbi:DUF418 domain-containing protein [Actinokineospora xionganensis]|uniref:DUF418 domain-containing protein n=1 Tax=Actinokineospora xionganensis TaxID=2684470 RepID=A0ABR7LCQ2_9PSEU|nr:DUF418 domain-containing protein [Actinokineospora xionganensis]MBC6450509.1 DUF418 domain-containing protein [Actinokineospora xionganensis]